MIVYVEVLRSCVPLYFIIIVEDTRSSEQSRMKILGRLRKVDFPNFDIVSRRAVIILHSCPFHGTARNGEAAAVRLHRLIPV